MAAEKLGEPIMVGGEGVVLWVFILSAVGALAGFEG